jgi:hypothetical protein
MGPDFHRAGISDLHQEVRETFRVAGQDLRAVVRFRIKASQFSWIGQKHFWDPALKREETGRVGNPGHRLQTNLRHETRVLRCAQIFREAI